MIKLVVLLNSDEWLTRKKGRPFMPFDERAKILESILDLSEAVNNQDDFIVRPFKAPQKKSEKQKVKKPKTVKKLKEEVEEEW